MSTEIENKPPVNVKQVEDEKQKFSRMLSGAIKELLETHPAELDHFIGWELILVSLSSGQSLSDNDKKKAAEQEAPILVKKGTQFSIYVCVKGEWKETELKSRELTHVEKTALNNLDFNVSTIKNTNLPNELHTLILRCHKDLIFDYNTTSNFINAYDQAYAEALSLISKQYDLRWGFDPCREEPSEKTVYVNYSVEKIFTVNYNGCKEYIVPCPSNINLPSLHYVTPFRENLPTDEEIKENTLYFTKDRVKCKFIGGDGNIREENIPNGPEFKKLDDHEFFHKVKDYLCERGLMPDEDSILNSMPLKAQIIECIFYNRIRDAIQFDKLMKKFPKVLSVFIKHYKAVFEASEEDAISYFRVMPRENLFHNSVGGNDAWKNIIKIINHCKYRGESVLDNWIRDINAPIKQIPYDPIGASQRMKKDNELSIKDIAALIYFDGAGQGYEDAIMLDVVERECDPSILPSPTEDEIERSKRWTSAVDFKNKFIAKIQTKGGLDYEPKKEIRNEAVEEKYRVIVPSGGGHTVKRGGLNNPVMFHIRFIGSEGKQETILDENERPYFGRKFGQVWDQRATQKYLDENRLGWHEDNMVETTSAENILIHKDELSQYLKKPEGGWLLEIIKGTLVERWIKIPKGKDVNASSSEGFTKEVSLIGSSSWEKEAKNIAVDILEKISIENDDTVEFELPLHADLVDRVLLKLGGDYSFIDKANKNEVSQSINSTFYLSKSNNILVATLATQTRNIFPEDKALKSLIEKKDIEILKNRADVRNEILKAFSKTGSIAYATKRGVVPTKDPVRKAIAWKELFPEIDSKQYMTLWAKVKLKADTEGKKGRPITS